MSIKLEIDHGDVFNELRNRSNHGKNSTGKYYANSLSNLNCGQAKGNDFDSKGNQLSFSCMATNFVILGTRSLAYWIATQKPKWAI